MTISDAGVDALLIIRAVAGERGDRTINLIEQGTDLRAVVNIVGGQRRRDDLASVRINPNVQFTPRGSASISVQNFALQRHHPSAKQFNAGAAIHSSLER